MDLLTYTLVAAGAFLFLLACYGWNQPRIALAIDNWNRPVQGLDEPPDLFYARVYQRLKQRLDEAGLPDSTIGFGSGHLFGNRTIFGARPQYLIVRYSHITFYLYAFRLPHGLYVSYWAFSKYTLWAEHPILKWVMFWRLHQMTLYQYDVMDMCLSTIHDTLFEVLDEYAAERGLKPLEEFERRPILHSYYARYKQGNVPQSGYVLPTPTLMPMAPMAPSGPIPRITPLVAPASVPASAPAPVPSQPE